MSLYVSNIYLTIRAQEFSDQKVFCTTVYRTVNSYKHKMGHVRWLFRAIEHITSKSFLEKFLALFLLGIVQVQDQTSSKLTNEYRYIEF